MGGAVARGSGKSLPPYLVGQAATKGTWPRSLRPRGRPPPGRPLCPWSGWRQGARGRPSPDDGQGGLTRRERAGTPARLHSSSGSGGWPRGSARPLLCSASSSPRWSPPRPPQGCFQAPLASARMSPAVPGPLQASPPAQQDCGRIPKGAFAGCVGGEALALPALPARCPIPCADLSRDPAQLARGFRPRELLAESREGTGQAAMPPEAPDHQSPHPGWVSRAARGAAPRKPKERSPKA